MRRVWIEERVGWHVFSRGSRRLDLFRDESDFREFLSILAFALKVSGCALMGYCLMSNHYHFILWGNSREVSNCMRRLNHLYSLYHNKKYDLSGHAFEGPYRAYLQGSPLLLLNRLAYVFLNPVTAKIVQKAESYPWSSFRSFMGWEAPPFLINPYPVLRILSDNAEQARQLFLQIMERQAARPKLKIRDVPTRTEIHLDQVTWLLEGAHDRASLLAPEDPMLVALFWGRQCGIPLYTLCRAPHAPPRHTLEEQLTALALRIQGDPDLARRLALP